MYDDMDYADYEEGPPPTKKVGQSILAVVIALSLGTAAVSLLLIHYVASGVGEIIWLAATIGPGFTAAYFLDKYVMTGYHTWCRLIVGGITFFSVAVFIGIGLHAHH
ncbi:MAG: hypothetical protein ABSF17_19300 [Terracidiphilus sp.]|jgi:hypothetical protein